MNRLVKENSVRQSDSIETVKKTPEEYEIWEKAIICAAGQKCDWTDKHYLAPVIDFAKK